LTQFAKEQNDGKYGAKDCPCDVGVVMPRNVEKTINEKRNS
jgi:hypothetical protein